MIKRIKDKWGIENNSQFTIILIVFAVTGSVSAKLSGPTAEYFEIETTQPAHLNLSRLPSRVAPHYSDASLTIKLPVRYFPRNLCLLQLPLLERPAGRLRPSQGYSRFSPRLGTLQS